MNILITGTMYEPDLDPSSPLFTMLGKELVKLGHRVTVITAIPHYPTAQVPNEFRGRLIRQSVEHGVTVLRVGVPSVNHKKLSQRFIQDLCFQLDAVLAGLRHNYDVILAGNPFLTVLLPLIFLGVIRYKPIVYYVQDVYPDIGIALGVFRSKLVYRSGCSSGKVLPSPGYSGSDNFGLI